MKAVYLVCALAMTISTFAQADSFGKRSIEDLNKDLGTIVGASVISNFEKGDSARTLIEQKYLKDHNLEKLDEDFQYADYVSDIEQADGTGVGTATPGAAVNYLLSMTDQFLNVDDDGFELPADQMKEKRSKIESIMKQLREAGAEFGFDANGSGVCGVNYTSLYVIDVKSKAITEYILVSGPC